MSDQARTYYHQALTAIEGGDPRRALDLLRRARLLASGDAQLTARILTEMVRVAPQAGFGEEQATWQQQLARLQTSSGAGSEDAPDHATALRRGWMPQTARRLSWGLSAAAVLAVLVYGGWRFWRYSAAQYEPVTTRPSTVAVRTPATTWEKRVSDDVGLVLWVQTYQGTNDGRQVELELPFESASAFAIGREGIMLTNAHVIRDVPNPPSLDGLLRVGPASMKVCFGADPKDHCDAKVLYCSASFDVAVLQVARAFTDPLPLSTKAVTQAEQVVAYGFPASVTGIESAANAASIVQHLERAGEAGHVSYRDWLPPNAFESVATSGIISSPDRTLHDVRYHLFDARVSGGNSGGPLLRAGGHEVIGIVTLAGTGLDAKDNNYALSLAQLQHELSKWLP
jgi:S1-C subfamily serine protease